MDWNRKRGVKILKSVGVKLGGKCHFLPGPAALIPTWRPNK